MHVNTLKKYVERDEPVRRLTVVAEEGSLANVRLKTKTSEYVEGDVESIKSDFVDALQEILRVVLSVLMWVVPHALHRLHTEYLIS